MSERRTSGSGYSFDELAVVYLSKEIRNDKISAVGTLSPIPAAAAYLAKVTVAPRAELLILDGEPWPFTSGSKEFFDLAQRGRLDLFFLSGAQIDRQGNINLTVIGNYDQPRVRLPGGAGSAMLYFFAKRVILFKADHTTRTFVPAVDFKTSAAVAPASVYRPGGPSKVLTPLCVFAFDKERQSLVLDSLHPGVTREEVAANTGFPVEAVGPVGTTPEPTAEELRLLRTVVRDRLAGVYPEFAGRL